MLSPEVWNFSPPPTKCNYKSGNLLSDSAVCTKLIDQHFFNHLVSVTLPDTVGVPDSIINSLSQDSDYYLVKNLAVSELIRKEFVDAFVKKGALTVLSDNTRIDTDDCLAVTPSGHLLLSLQTETYQELGIEGKPSFFSHKNPSRFVVDLDLCDQHFTVGSKNYERVRVRLDEQLNFKFSIMLAWEPPNESVCPSSIAAYLSTRGHEVSVHPPSFQMRTDCDVAVPLLQVSSDVQACSFEEMVEWLGAYTIGADLKYGGPENFISSYEMSRRNLHCSQVVHMQWTGFFTSKQVRRLFEEIGSYITFSASSPWVGTYVQGFADSLVSWGLKEHHYYTNGDNNFVIFLRPDNFYMTCSILSSNKGPSSKLSSK